MEPGLKHGYLAPCPSLLLHTLYVEKLHIKGFSGHLRLRRQEESDCGHSVTCKSVPMMVTCVYRLPKHLTWKGRRNCRVTHFRTYRMIVNNAVSHVSFLFLFYNILFLYILRIRIEVSSLIQILFKKITKIAKKINSLDF